MMSAATTRRYGKHFDVLSIWRRIVAWMVVTAVVAIGLATKNPGVHEHVHEDAGHSDHVCAITLAAAGYCDTSAAAPGIAPDEVAVECVLASPASHAWMTPAYWLIPSQAPPA